MLSANKLDLSLKQYDFFQKLAGAPICEVSHVPGEIRWEALEMALLDLTGRLRGCPATALLGLTGTAAVPGEGTILTDDLAQFRTEVTAWRDAGYRSHLKIKLFGKVEIDLRLILAAREIYGPTAVVSGDANGGYGKRSVEEMAVDLRRLHQAGLSNLEDPTDSMDVAIWVALQQQLPELPLIVDVPMRPASHGLEVVRADMAGAVNLHPDCMGSLAGAAALGAKAKALGMRLMIGDNSFIGPGCTAWQQLAIALNADWVEALEKPAECDILQRCTRACATQRDTHQRITRGAGNGFGLELDVAQLRTLATDYRRWA